MYVFTGMYVYVRVLSIRKRACVRLSVYARLCLRASESRNFPPEFYSREKEGGLRRRREGGVGRKGGFEGDRFECGFGPHFLVYT